MCCLASFTHNTQSRTVPSPSQANSRKLGAPTCGQQIDRQGALACCPPCTLEPATALSEKARPLCAPVLASTNGVLALVRVCVDRNLLLVESPIDNTGTPEFQPSEDVGSISTSRTLTLTSGPGGCLWQSRCPGSAECEASRHPHQMAWMTGRGGW